MGLFLGYAILNLPTMLLILYGCIKRSMLNIRPSKIQPTRKHQRGKELDQNLLLIFGTTSIMLSTIEGSRPGFDEKEDKTEDNVYSNILKSLDTRLRKVEEKLN